MSSQMGTDSLRNKGISAIEYCILLILVISALLTMQVYFKRAIQGRWRAASDSIGLGMQYEIKGPVGSFDSLESSDEDEDDDEDENDD